MKMLTNKLIFNVVSDMFGDVWNVLMVSIFKFFPDMSKDVRGVLIHNQWCQTRDLEPPVINFFSNKKKN